MHRPNSLTLLLLLSFVATAAAAQSPSAGPPDSNAASAAPDLNTLVDHVEEAQLRNRAHYRAYVMTREYRLYGGDAQRPSSEVVAQVNFVPPDQKTFAIERSSGSSRGAKIVKNILEGESKRAGQYEHNSLTRDNYGFKYLGQVNLNGHPCYLLQLIPKREQTDLVKGRAWVDAKTYLVRRVEGQLAKSPSWWLKSVTVALTFDEAGGMWLQTSTWARADVRLFGRHTLESQTVDLRTEQSVAQRRRSRPVRPMRPGGVAGEAVFVHP